MQNSDFRTRIASLYVNQPSSVVLCIHNSDIMTRINSLYGSQSSPVILCMQNSVISITIASLYRSQTSPVDLWMENIVISNRNTSLHWCQPSSVVFACKTETLGPELQVSMGPRPHQCFFAFKTATLAPQLQVSMGPNPHLRGTGTWWRHVSTTWCYRIVNYTREAAAGVWSKWSLLMSVLRRFLQSSIHPRASCLVKIGRKKFSPAWRALTNTHMNARILFLQTKAKLLPPPLDLWFLHAKQRLLDQIYKSSWVSDLTDFFLHSNQRL